MVGGMQSMRSDTGKNREWLSGLFGVRQGRHDLVLRRKQTACPMAGNEQHSDGILYFKRARVMKSGQYNKIRNGSCDVCHLSGPMMFETIWAESFDKLRRSLSKPSGLSTGSRLKARKVNTSLIRIDK